MPLKDNQERKTKQPQTPMEKKFKSNLRRCLIVLEQSDIQLRNLISSSQGLLTCSVLTLNFVHYLCVNMGTAAMAHHGHTWIRSQRIGAGLKCQTQFRSEHTLTAHIMTSTL